MNVLAEIRRYPHLPASITLAKALLAMIEERPALRSTYTNDDVAFLRMVAGHKEYAMPGEPETPNVPATPAMPKASALVATRPKLTTLHRAANGNGIRPGHSFASHIDDAKEYLNNPGFGGNKLWKTNVSLHGLLDLTGPHPWDDLSDAIDEDVDPSRHQFHFPSAITASNKVLDKLRAKGHRWVKFVDDFPEGSHTYVPISDDAAAEAETNMQEHGDEPSQYDKRSDLHEALADVHPEPSEAQKDAGNYRKGHFAWKGLDISIETAPGQSRRPEWPPLKDAYGYVKRTLSRADGDHVDVFVCDDHIDSDVVFCVNQLNADGDFDEHKFILGQTNAKDAREAYLRNYTSGWKCGKIVAMTVKQFRAWLEDGNTAVEVDPDKYGRDDDSMDARARRLIVEAYAKGGPESVNDPSGVSRAQNEQASQNPAQKPAKPPTPAKAVSPLGFYHPATEAVKTWQPKGTPAQLLAHLGKHAGAMAHAEVAGLHAHLAGKPSVTRDEVLAHLAKADTPLSEHGSGYSFIRNEQEHHFDNEDDMRDAIMANVAKGKTPAEQASIREQHVIDDGNEPHFSKYVLPGPSENYRELHVTAPGAEGRKVPYEPIDVSDYKGTILRRDHDGSYRLSIRKNDGRGDNGEGTHVDIVNVNESDPNKALENWVASQNSQRYRQSKKSESWEDGHSEFSHVKNPVVRVRHNDRVDADGSRALHIEEMQGPQDAHQQKMPEHLRDRIYDIGVKRMLRKAVDGGYDKLTWTTGSQQQDRYSLRKHLDELRWEPVGREGRGVLTGYKNGEKIVDKRDLNASDLGKYVGDDVAANLLASPQSPNERKGAAYSPYHSLRGDDLAVGGHGLASVYDRVIPSIVGKLTKKAGGRVEATKVRSHDSVEVKNKNNPPFREPDDDFVSQFPWMVFDKDGELAGEYKTKEEAQQHADRISPPHTVHSLTITPEIAALVRNGFSQYARDGEPERFIQS